MRKLFLVLASSMALAFAACDRDANNNQKPYGGGPAPESTAGGSTNNTFDEGSKTAPVGSAAHELPGMPASSASSEAMESNGGSGAGATGTKGEGTTLHNGFNDKNDKSRPIQGQKKVDLAPGKP